ncbi:MAG: glycosyltransferase family 39 protein [Candidatus Eremiobacteraeota bacterium]|nr:glycosyltransferase family 39 protein [Candidatus Eremiobacteraeota bacterium]MBV8499329.1 glycosyltransferase family 39 protein [Candidatus Eremiobacteraeota bacterium]
MIGVALALGALLFHAAAASRYGYFRDELYFIACSKHLAWGYVDQPPFVAAAAWLAGPAGYSLLALRALPIVAAALTVYLAVRLAADLGGGRFAQCLCGVATMLMPAYLLLGNTLTTTSLEPLFWTLATLLAVRIVRSAPANAPPLWAALGVVAGLGAYAKYSMALPIAGIGAGLLATAERRVLRSAYPLYACGLAVLLLSPNLAWQAAHGWPFIEVLRGDATHRPELAGGYALEYRAWLANAGAFSAEQFIYTNPAAVPIWVAGLIAPFRLATLRELRFVPIAYAVVVLVALAFGAKGYYVIGFYAPLLAIGAVALERVTAYVRATLFALVVALGLAALPLSLPVLPVDGLIAYTKLLGLTGRDRTPPRLIQPLFAEEFGWQRLARDVAIVYFSLPPSLRARTAVYADTYGDAGALDFYGPRYGLPGVISSQNNYYLWGTRGYDGRSLIAIGATRTNLLRRYYRSVVLVRTSAEPYKWIVEGPAPIYLCRDPVAPLSLIWPHLRWYGA